MCVFDYHRAMATQTIPTSVWAKALAAFSALAGASGSVLTPLLGTSLSSASQTVLQAISGLLVLIPATSAVMLNHAQARVKVTAEAEKAVAPKP